MPDPKISVDNICRRACKSGMLDTESLRIKILIRLGTWLARPLFYHDRDYRPVFERGLEVRQDAAHHPHYDFG
jgi:hypothetical protein